MERLLHSFSFELLTHHGASCGGAVLCRATADAAVQALLPFDEEDGRVRTEGRSVPSSSSSGKRLPQSVHLPGPRVGAGASSWCCSDEGEEAAAAARKKKNRRTSRSGRQQRKGIASLKRKKESLLSIASVRSRSLSLSRSHSSFPSFFLHPLRARERKKVRTEPWLLLLFLSLPHTPVVVSQLHGAQTESGMTHHAPSQEDEMHEAFARATTRRRHWRGGEMVSPVLFSLFQLSSNAFSFSLFLFPLKQRGRERDLEAATRDESKRRKRERRKKKSNTAKLHPVMSPPPHARAPFSLLFFSYSCSPPVPLFRALPFLLSRGRARSQAARLGGMNAAIGVNKERRPPAKAKKLRAVFFLGERDGKLTSRPRRRRRRRR